jgi:two-component system sensor histidine kinase KdpD
MDETEGGRLRPEEAIAKVKEESRGLHRVYLGYAAGVGKTYQMLREGNLLLGQGHDVVIGFLETYNRKDTISQIKRLKTVPRRRVAYKGVILEEMDVDAILARHPEWVLVDELAHTNISESKHEKRYQDVEELLAAGINVMSTVNIQHMESLNETVRRITGVNIRETFPDWILDQADEIITVDITPEILQDRMRQGKIYAADKAAQALKHFFRKGNLLALREMALRKTAEETEDMLGAYKRSKRIDEPWPTYEKVMVGITIQPNSKDLIRRAWRLASRLQGELYVAHVVERGLSPEERHDLHKLFRFAQELGAQVVTLEGRDTIRKMVDFARQKEITQLVLGAQRPSWWDVLRWRGSPVDRVLRLTDQLDIIVVSNRDRAE